ncbi:hypothetical protein [Streptomyces sp. NPDC001933]
MSIPADSTGLSGPDGSRTGRAGIMAPRTRGVPTEYRPGNHRATTDE